MRYIVFFFSMGAFACTDNSDTSRDGGADNPTDQKNDPDEKIDFDMNAASAQISTWIDELPWGQDNIPTPQARQEVIDAIIKACLEFAPPGDEWQTWCEAQLTSSICRESSFDRMSIVDDDYGDRTVDAGQAYDPTVGLLQIRFSATVQDYNGYGNLDSLRRIGCDYPDLGHEDESGDSEFWAITGPTEYMWLMQDVACNVAFGSWYYYIHATGNGDPPCWVDEYCAGQGVAANLAMGLMSHARGPEDAVLGAQDSYVEEIKAWFDMFLGPIDPHPFDIMLNPEPEKYCQ